MQIRRLFALFFILVVFFFLFLFFWFPLQALDPSIVYLSWKGDPSTTMTVLWFRDSPTESHTVDYKAIEDQSWQSHEGSVEKIVHSNLHIYQVELTDLLPDTEYLFQFGGEKIYRFKTLPKELDRPLKIAIGGDVYFSKPLHQKMSREVAGKDPDFVILGGDIAYTEGIRRALRSQNWKVRRWKEFFQMWSDQMVTDSGRLIPIVPVVGNHDVKEGFDHPSKRRFLFLQFFPFKEENSSFRMMKIGEEVCFYLLDSGHLFPIGGRQTEWLKEMLQTNRLASYHIPVYHVGAYPTETSYTHRGSTDIRKFWCPLFEKYGVKVAMEHDSHTFKRTFPLIGGRFDREGVIYLGDGAWGVPPCRPKKHRYLEKVAKTNNYWLLTIDRERTLFQAFNNEGFLIDQLAISGVSSSKASQEPAYSAQ